MTPAERAAGRREKRVRHIVTPEGVALPLSLASRGSRAAALMLDLVILNVVTILTVLLLLWTAFGTIEGGDIEQLPGAAGFLLIVAMVFWFVSWNGYFIFFEMGPRGATLGKRILGIRVAARGGGRLTAEAVLARNLLRDIELFVPLVLMITAPEGGSGPAGWAATAWFLVFLLFPFFNKDRLRAGDLIAGTWVLDAPRMKLADTMSTSSSVATSTSELTGYQYKFGESELSVYGEYELQTLERVLRDGREQAIEAVAETICRKIGWHPGSGDERAFLEAFYAQLRARLESDMRFGKRKADKFS